MPVLVKLKLVRYVCESMTAPKSWMAEAKVIRGVPVAAGTPAGAFGAGVAATGADVSSHAGSAS